MQNLQDPKVSEMRMLDGEAHQLHVEMSKPPEYDPFNRKKIMTPQHITAMRERFDEKFENWRMIPIQNSFPLSVKEKEILKMRNGYDDGITHTLEEVGKKFQVTRERIRQIESKAYEKIKLSDEIKAFIESEILLARKQERSEIVEIPVFNALKDYKQGDEEARAAIIHDMEKFWIGEISLATKTAEERVLREIIEHLNATCLEYCRDQNGREDCKNCGLSMELLEEYAKSKGINLSE